MILYFAFAFLSAAALLFVYDALSVYYYGNIVFSRPLKRLKHKSFAVLSASVNIYLTLALTWLIVSITIFPFLSKILIPIVFGFFLR